MGLWQRLQIGFPGAQNVGEEFVGGSAITQSIATPRLPRLAVNLCGISSTELMLVTVLPNTAHDSVPLF